MRLCLLPILALPLLGQTPGPGLPAPAGGQFVLNDPTVLDENAHPVPAAELAQRLRSGDWTVRTVRNPDGTLKHLQLARLAPGERKPRAVPAETAAEAQARVGKPFPAFEFTDMKGRLWRSADLAGKIVYLNLWFIRCAPCVQEMPSLNELQAKYQDNPAVVLLSVTMDGQAAVAEFLAKTPFHLPVACVSMDAVQRLGGSGSGAVGFPTHLLIDPEGKLALTSTGGGEGQGREIGAAIDRLLRTSRSPSK